MANNVKVTCITTGKVFKSISAAARAACAKMWTMSYKMDKAGSFVDSLGRKYTREKPMITKNNYKNTGNTLKKIYGKRKTPKPHETQALPMPPIVSLEPAPAIPRIDTQKYVSDVIMGKIQDICEQKGIWPQVNALLNALDIINQKD